LAPLSRFHLYLFKMTNITWVRVQESFARQLRFSTQ
jgi:hypothetical protein